MGKQVVLSARDLRIGYGNKTIADSISFELEAAEVLCLLGPNGSGKSTLFKTVLGLVPALAGQISVLNQPLARW